MRPEQLEIGKLFDELVELGYEVQDQNGYEIIVPDGYEIRTIGNRFVKLTGVSRHKTDKHIFRFVIKQDNDLGRYEVVSVTSDHVMMTYDKDHFFENRKAKDISIGAYVSVYDEKTDSEVRGIVKEIHDDGTISNYVYDCEVDDDVHSFYVNNVLVHNSQFVNIQCVTNHFRKEHSLPKNIIEWDDEHKLEFWNLMNDFVENEVNGFVHETARRICHTEHPEVLRYSLEYIADRQIMEGKKHYSCRKVLVEGPEIVDKIKYSGIELKKANTPLTAKEFLSEIYSGVLTKDWSESDLKEYLNVAYERYRKLDITEISFWKGYGTEREAAGFLEMKKGTTGISKACTFYNQILEKMGIGGRYDTLRPGNKARFCYIKPTNKYRINVIAFVDGQYPEEFRGLFEPDYDVMFEKMILDPLKNFLKACGFRKSDPRNCNLMEVDDL